MRKHETYEEEYEEYDLPTEPQDEPEDPQATIEQTVVNGHCISIEKFFDGFSVGDYAKSPPVPWTSSQFVTATAIRSPTPVRPSMKHAQSMRRASRPPANRGRERKLRKLSNPRTSLQPLWVALD